MAWRRRRLDGRGGPYIRIPVNVLRALLELEFSEDFHLLELLVDLSHERPIIDRSHRPHGRRRLVYKRRSDPRRRSHSRPHPSSSSGNTSTP